MAANGLPSPNRQGADSSDQWGHAGFQRFNDGLLDHLAEAGDRVELDLFDDGNRKCAAPYNQFMYHTVKSVRPVLRCRGRHCT